MLRRAALLSMTAIALPAIAQTPKLSLYRDKSEGFSVLLPSTPHVQANDTTTQGIEIKSKTYIAPAGKENYVVSKIRIPKNAKPDFYKQIVTGFEFGLLRMAGATKTSDTSAVYGGRTVRRIDFDLAHGGKGAAIMFRTPDAFYALALGNQLGKVSPTGERFLRSFQLK